jgi:hypothetical protein
MDILNNLKSLLGGNITIHQEFINKLIKEAVAENKAVREIVLEVGEGFLNVRAEITVGVNIPVSMEFKLTLGNYEFNRTKRFVELLLLSPAAVSVYGIRILTRLAAEIDENAASLSGAPESLINVFGYLTIKEDRLILDFNKMPGFTQALQKKTGFLLKNLEITKLDLRNEMIVMHPSMKML